MKSLRNLLWVLWGLGWIIVPLLLREVHGQRYIPLVMFGALAALLVVTWHKGAVIRAILRSALARSTRGANANANANASASASAAPPPAAARRPRIDVSDAQRVRVHATELRPDEAVGITEIERDERTSGEGARRAREIDR